MKKSKNIDRVNMYCLTKVLLFRFSSHLEKIYALYFKNYYDISQPSWKPSHRDICSPLNLIFLYIEAV